MIVPQNIKCMLIDDEPLALYLLEDYIAKTEGLSLAAKISRPLQALEFLKDNSVDLIFLDMQMPELTGIQIMRLLDKQFPVIITSAYSEYAMDGYHHDVIDYLLKPISYERFLLAVGKARQRTVAPAEPQSVFVKSGHKMIQVLFADIDFLEAKRDYVELHTRTGKILTLQSLQRFEETLPADRFIRIHRSYMVNLDKVSLVEKRVVTVAGIKIPVGLVYAGNLRKHLP